MATVWTTVVLTACCEVSEPGYVPPPRPYYSRTPGYSAFRCDHILTRVPTVTEHETEEDARRHLDGYTRGWYTTDGYMFPGAMPDAPVFIAPIGGSLVHGFLYGPAQSIPFPSVESARAYAERWAEYPNGKREKHILYNVTDADGTVVWSSYNLPAGTVITPGDCA